MSMFPRWSYVPVTLVLIVSLFTPSALVFAENKNKGVATQAALDATFTAIDIAITATVAAMQAKDKAKETTAKTKATTAETNSVPTHDAATYEILTGAFKNTQKTAGEVSKEQAQSKKNWAVYLYKTVLQGIAITLLNKLTEATVNWINTGFEGNPQYVENPEQFFKNTGETYLKNIVDTIGYDTSKYPYGRSVARALIQNYLYENSSLEDKLQFTFDKVVGDDWRNFQVDFQVGGWNAYEEFHNKPANNSFDFFFAALEAKHKAVTTAQQRLQQELQEGRGFLNQKICVAERKGPAYNVNVNVGVDETLETAPEGPDGQQPIEVNGSGGYDWTSGVGGGYTPPGSENTVTLGEGSGTGANNSGNGTGTYGSNYPTSNGVSPGTGTGECLRYKTLSPGAVVEQQINRALQSTKFGQSEFAAALGNSISNIVNALSNLLATKGLGALGSATNGSGSGLSVNGNNVSWSYDGLSLSGQPNDLTAGADSTTGSTSVWDIPEQTTDLYELLVTGPVISTHMVTDANGVVSFVPDEYGDSVVVIAEKELQNYQDALASAQTMPTQLLALDQCLPGPDMNWEQRFLDRFEQVRGQLTSAITASGASNSYGQSLATYLDTVQQSISSLVTTKVNTYNIPGFALMKNQFSQSNNLEEKILVYEQKIADLTGIVNQLHSMATQVENIGPAEDLTPAESTALESLVNQYLAIQQDLPSNASLAISETEKNQIETTIDAVGVYLDTNNPTSCPNQKIAAASQHNFNFVITPKGVRTGTVISGTLSSAQQSTLSSGTGIPNLVSGEQVLVDQSYSQNQTYSVTRPISTSMVTNLSSSQMITELSNSPYSAGSANLSRLNALSQPDLALVYSVVVGNASHQYFPNVPNGPTLVTLALDWLEMEQGATPITVDMTVERMFYCQQILDNRDVRNLLKSWNVNISCNDFYESSIDDYQ